MQIQKNKIIVYLYLAYKMRASINSGHIYRIEEQQKCTDRFTVATDSVSSFIFCALPCESSIHRCKRFLWDNVAKECFLYSKEQHVLPKESQSNLKRYGQRPSSTGKLVNIYSFISDF